MNLRFVFKKGKVIELTLEDAQLTTLNKTGQLLLEGTGVRHQLLLRKFNNSSYGLLSSRFEVATLTLEDENV